MSKIYTVTEDADVRINGDLYRLEKGDKIRILSEEDWPKEVEEGDLRKRMELSQEKPLEDQTSPSEVAEFFNNTDAKGRGMVMFAVNSNKNNEFWKSVHNIIKKNSDE